VPAEPWAMRMRWRELLFAHWPLDEQGAERIRALVPPGLELDRFEGRCYIGAVPFLMENTTPRLVPPIPGLHAFPELNLRTYVVAGGKPGVWFFSLDAGSKVAVRVARRFFHLPYFDAKFHVEVVSASNSPGSPPSNSSETGRVDLQVCDPTSRSDQASESSPASQSGTWTSRSGLEAYPTVLENGVAYRAVRTHPGAAPAAFDAVYRPIGEVYRSEAGTLEHWLTARYCLYSADAAGTVFRGEIDHAQWPLQRAEAEIRVNTLGDWLGLSMRGEPETLHFARSLDVRAWMIRRAA